MILLGFDKGKYKEKHLINELDDHMLNISMRKIDRVVKRFVEDGLEVALSGIKGNRTDAKKADDEAVCHG